MRPWEEAEEGGSGCGGCATWLGAFSAQGLCSVFSRASGPEKSAGEPSGDALRGERNSGTSPRGEGTRPVRPRGVSVGLLRVAGAKAVGSAAEQREERGLCTHCPAVHIASCSCFCCR